MKKIFIVLSLLIISAQVLADQIKLSLDLEIKEPKNIIFSRLEDIATDSKNYIYVLDEKESVIYSFNEEGRFLKIIGRAGNGPGEFIRPFSIFIDSKDEMYVLDDENRRIEIFDRDGHFIKSVKIMEFPGGHYKNIIVDKEGNIYISGYYREPNKVLAKFTSKGELLKYFPVPVIEYKGLEFDMVQRMQVDEWLSGGSICFDNEGRIFFSYAWPHLIKAITPEGDELFRFPGSSNLNWTPLLFRNDPKGLTWGEMTGTRKIFFLRNNYLANSISVVDWEGDPKRRVNPLDILKDPTKYYRIKRRFSLLEFFTKKGELIGSAEIDGKIYFLASDKKERILGIKYDEEDMPRIIRYNVETIKNK